MLDVRAGADHHWRAAGACPSSVTSATGIAALHDHPPREVVVDVVMRLQADNGMHAQRRARAAGQSRRQVMLASTFTLLSFTAAYQEHMPQPREMLGLLALQPQDLAGRESWHQLVLKLLGQLPSLICTLHVAPQLCRADDLHPAPPQSHPPCIWRSISWSRQHQLVQQHLVVRVERHEAMLLSTD
jgi:hypothetical protein